MPNILSKENIAVGENRENHVFFRSILNKMGWVSEKFIFMICEEERFSLFI